MNKVKREQKSAGRGGFPIKAMLCSGMQGFRRLQKESREAPAPDNSPTNAVDTAN
jgi:hypothetical protein